LKKRLKVLEDDFKKANDEAEKERKEKLDGLKETIEANTDRLKKIVGWLPAEDQAVWEKQPGVWEPLFQARNLAATLFEDHKCRDICGCQPCADDREDACTNGGECKLDGNKLCVLAESQCSDFTCPDDREAKPGATDCRGSTCNYVCCDEKWPNVTDYVRFPSQQGSGSGTSSLTERLADLAREHLISTTRLANATKALYESLAMRGEAKDRIGGRNSEIAEHVLAAERLVAVQRLLSTAQEASSQVERSSSVQGFLQTPKRSQLDR